MSLLTFIVFLSWTSESSEPIRGAFITNSFTGMR